MISLALLALGCLSPASPGVAVFPDTVSGVPDDTKQEYEKRRAEADGDTAKLWPLVDWCDANSLKKQKRSCLRAILKLDKHDKRAHEMLDHLWYDEQWFTSEKKLAVYKRKEEQRMAKEKGLVRFRDGWAHPDDIPFLEKGLTKMPDGSWVDAEEMRRIEEGWRQQDLTWISPAEFDQADQGLWKCGDSWLSLADANEYHSELGRWWTIPGTYFHLYTTLPRELAMQALGEVDRTYRDLKRIYGVGPTEPIRVLVLNSTDQYGVFAAGEDGKWPAAGALGLSSVHGAFFAELWFNTETGEWLGAGAAYWDSEQWGKLFTRHAAGQSYGEYVDPSPKAVARAEKERQARLSTDDFYGEKAVPAWFRYGAASYVERYFIDAYVGADGDPHWARKWAVSNIARRGGLDSLSTIFEMTISPDNPDSDKVISEGGLLVAFMIDGASAPVKEKHGAVKAALKSGKGIDKAFAALEQALEKHSDDLRMFADL